MKDLKTFISNPLASMLFIVTISIGYLYIENRQVYQQIIESHAKEILHLRNEIKVLQSDYHALNDKFIEAIRYVN
jgi:hypothetical protein